MSSISPSTGEPFYSGDWKKDVSSLIKAVNVGDGIMNTVSMVNVEQIQEEVDRLIDSQLQSLYKVPFSRLKIYNYQTNIFERKFPGKLAEVAKYWTAALIMKNEFQQVDGNINESVQNYLDYAQRLIAEIKSHTERLEGQEWRADLSVFMPPNVMPIIRQEPPSPL